MIEKLIEEYKQSLEFNKQQYDKYNTNDEFYEIVREYYRARTTDLIEFIKDLEELKKEQDYYKKAISRLLADVDDNYDTPFDLRNDVDNFILGVDRDE